MNKKIEKEHDERQRFSLRKLSVGLASVLVGVSFMTISAGQTVHADSLQKPSQSDLATKKADNVTNDSANDNEQNQAKSDTAQTINHVDANSNRQQNADKNEAEASATTATNAIVDRQVDVTTASNKNSWGDIAKDDANKVQETVNPPQKAMANQKKQATVAFSVKKVNKAITTNMLNENKVADAQNGDSVANNGVDPVKFAANGGFDPNIWGTMNIGYWQLDASGNITGYTGDTSHIIIPNSADFAKAGKNYRQISISSDEMKELIRRKDTYGDGDEQPGTLRGKTNTLAISLTNDKKVKATNADWSNVFELSVLRKANLEGLDTDNVTNMSGMFSQTYGLMSLDVSKWNTSNVTNMSHMFSADRLLTSLDVSKWNTSNVTDMSYMFGDVENLTSLDVSNWNTGNVTNMGGMFSSSYSLNDLDVSKWNTSKVTDMSWMFSGSISLTDLDVSKWDTSKVTDMSWMFDLACSLTSLDVSNWDTSNVTNMSGMFTGVSSLTSLDVSNWDTSNVTNMSEMFTGANGLTSLDVSKWDTRNVTDMNSMFDGASGLKSLDVSKWDTSKVTNMGWMFDGDNKLVLIANNTSDWQHATDSRVFDGVPVVITNNANILNVTDNGNYTIDDNATTRSVIFNSANSELKLPAYKGYANYTSDADRLKYASDVIKVYNDKLMQDYSATHTDKMLKYANDQDMNDPVALARTKFVTTPKVEDILDNPANHDKLYATATREYIIHNIDGSTTTITQSIDYHRTGKHNLATNEDTFTEWIYSPDKNSVVVVVTTDKIGKAIANPIAVEGDNCIERDGKAYFGSLKIKPKAGFKLALDKPATTKLNLQAKLASRLLPRQFFVLKAFAPMPHEMTKQVASANSIKPKQDHNNASIEPITSANAIKQGKGVIVKPIVTPIEPNEQANAGSPINGLANSEAQLADVQNISMAKPDVNDQRSMQVANLSTENSQKSVEAKSQHPAVSINGKVKSAEIAAKSADSRQNQNKKVLAEKASAKPIANISMANISTKAKKVSVKPAVNIPAKTAQPATQKIATIAKKQTIANPSLPQTSSVNDSDALVAIGLIMVSLDIALAGTRKHE